MKNLSLNSKTALVILTLSILSQSASAGIVGDAMGTPQAKWFIVFLFGVLGAGLGGSMIIDYINGQDISKPFHKIAGIGLCLLGIVKTNTITAAFSNF